MELVTVKESIQKQRRIPGQKGEYRGMGAQHPRLQNVWIYRGE